MINKNAHETPIKETPKIKKEIYSMEVKISDINTKENTSQVTISKIQKDALHRIRTQIPLEKKVEKSSFKIDNTCNIKILEQRVDKILQQFSRNDWNT